MGADPASHLQTSNIELPSGTRLLALDETDSTNAEAMRRLAAGETGPLWIVAGRQTGGRGRSGRSWTSEPGNLFASLLITFSAHAAAQSYQLSLVAGVAAIDAIVALAVLRPGATLRLKWPNDVLLGGEKLGGILVESTTVPAGLGAVIGIGVNLVSHPSGTTLPATNLAAHGSVPAKEIIVPALATTVADWLLRWHEGAGFAEVRSAWLERAGPIGERCSVHRGQERIEGRFAGIDGDGALLIAGSDGRTQRVSYGDVTLSR